MDLESKDEVEAKNRSGVNSFELNFDPSTIWENGVF